MKYDPRIFSTSNLYSPTSKALEKYLASAHSGKIVEEFESRFADYHDSQCCVAFGTGFWALVASILVKTQGQKGRHVLMPSMTYRRLADVVTWAGFTPHFVDIDASNLAMCKRSLVNELNSDAALILAVHPIVNCCSVDELIDISCDSGVPILFDAVESVHETYRRRRVGSFGVGEVFSLHASKLINGIEGGYVCSDQGFGAELSTMLKTNHYAKESNVIQSSIHPLHCAYALAGLDNIEENVRHNKCVYREYASLLSGHPYISLLAFNEEETTSFKNIVVRVDETCPMSRDQLLIKLNALGIMCRAHYNPPLHEKETSYVKYIPELPVTNEAKNRYLNLPCGQRLSETNVSKVIEEINSILGV